MAGALKPGELVSGRVVSHEPYGFFVDVGQPELGVVLITMIEDDPRIANPRMPDIGETVVCVFLGYAGPGRQPRLSMRPMDVGRVQD